MIRRPCGNGIALLTRWKKREKEIAKERMGTLDAASGFKALANRVNLPHVCQDKDDELANRKPFYTVVGAFIRCNFDFREDVVVKMLG